MVVVGKGALLSQPHHYRAVRRAPREMGRTPTPFPLKLDGAFDAGFHIGFFNLKLE